MRLIDADALMESIGCADAVKYGNRDRAQQDTSYSTMMLYEIRDEIDAQPTVSGWVSVKDRLPDVDQRVLVSLVSELDGHRMKNPEIGYTIDPDGKMWFITTWKEWAIDSDLEVTHWRPMPEQPEEVRGDG